MLRTPETPGIYPVAPVQTEVSPLASRHQIEDQTGWIDENEVETFLLRRTTGTLEVLVFDNKLYKLFGIFDSLGRYAGLSVSAALARQNIKSVITANPKTCRVWVEMKCQGHLELGLTERWVDSPNPDEFPEKLRMKTH